MRDDRPAQEPVTKSSKRRRSVKNWKNEIKRVRLGNLPAQARVVKNDLRSAA
jgi:hypothetical protein